MSRLATVIMAAGKGTRMKSGLPKVLHKLAGRPMLGWVLAAAQAAGAERNVVVVGHGAEEVSDFVGASGQCVVQAEQLGTAHAVMTAAAALAGFDGQVLVLSGDTPLLTGEGLREFIDWHAGQAAACTVAVVRLDGDGYGRVVTDRRGNVLKIVEQKDASPDELAVRDLNAGLYCFDCRQLLAALPQVTADNAQREYYLTDVPGIIARNGGLVRAYHWQDGQQLFGVNSRADLAQAGRIMRQRINRQLMLDGVTMLDPDSVYIDYDVDCLLYTS
ncbi:MAG: NTP transferase domain-containing protein, partial [Negativicutes bacterium]|nr:NTP transferase domain-containing protein [Negativicutes bacterium]